MSSHSGPRSGTLRAVLREVEPGLYRAEYSGEINPADPDAREIPDYHVGTDASGVKMWVEEMAAGMGYEGVTWDPADDASPDKVR